MDYTTDSHTVWKDDNGRIIDLHCFEYVEDGIYMTDTLSQAKLSQVKEKSGILRCSA